ncbi:MULTISPECIES: M20 family metallopeptidase [unclassified Paenibacillus]|uniref:M20 family metallopeptidase n=1 Tax=unclassified Paenibacillus TaxID=185978 RepID=UPI0024073BAF|nr:MULTISPECIES: M20 family metallopeptidase [unclassified Paenibacillus]MDF9842245.1 succinyl-diaminopimelate desuccinylase [Paenibacillus sp. PastF-2]MDF9848878.1 succinyl-diaminopimelate desuccinylase [Paenibacillus sp. PastM-2]MDF9855448.1 succinyl-diaminopimelate desuccinylase [Paenibacillus sp. PastF-1]MDH6480676.1 succinyl-diaminopimelate desuccinylase [Paenibacillus sp. PastH-2]MDH6508143.1 succinyl-diaminopimelate desuccinylase [Paenibacillus sp. PastM-3]
MIDVRSREFAVPFLQSLIQVDTCNPPGNEHRLALLLQEYLREEGLDSRVITVEQGRSNLEAVVAGGGGRKLMFCGHLDTVSPWTAEAGKYPPHGAVIEGSRMYGRGTSDMKGGLAAMLLAAVSLQQEGIRLGGDLIVLATAGEEVDSCGARHYAEQHNLEELDGLVIAEPTGSRVAVGHKGALWLRITLYGRSAHGSMPHLGLNAVEGMMEVIALLKRHALEWQAHDPVLGSSSLSVNTIAGGVQTNVIADRCSIDVDIRTVPPLLHAELLAGITAKLDGMQQLNAGFRYEVEELLDRSVVYTDPAEELIRTALELAGWAGEGTEQSKENGSAGIGVAAERAAGGVDMTIGTPTGGDAVSAAVQGVSYYTDASVLHNHGKLPVLIYGPGDPKLAHQPDEWIDIEAYLESISFYRELAVRFLGVAAD